MNVHSVLKSLFILLVLFIGNNAEASVIKGKITDTEGNPIVASIHISTLKVGAFSNTDGYYELNISSGIHDIDFLYPGYRTKNIHLEVKEDTAYVADIIMDKAIFSIPQNVKDKKNDQSGLNKIAQIVQQEIYNRNVLKNVKAEIYSKGTANTQKVYPILRKAIRYTPFSFLATCSNVFTEYIDSTEYTYPDQFTRKVDDINGNIPNPEVFVKVLDEMSFIFIKGSVVYYTVYGQYFKILPLLL